MNSKWIVLVNSLLMAIVMVLGLGGEVRADEMEQKLKPFIEEAKHWAASPDVVSATKKANESPAAAYSDMTQDKWKSLSLLDPLVRDLAKNPTAEFLKSKKNEKITEIFLSAANGTKVAFLAKTSNWSHKGKPKHDVPMAGKIWIGKVETDESSGMQQIQFAVPVLEAGKPIGSLVVGVSVSKL